MIKTVKKFHVGGHGNHPMNLDADNMKGTQPRPNPYHGGSGRPLGTTHAPSPQPVVNAANYGQQKIKKRK
jgi:hypothetical protein